MIEKGFDCKDEDIDECTRILLRNADEEDMRDLITFMNEHGIDWEIL